MNKFELKYKKILLNILLKGENQNSRNGEVKVLNNIKISHNLNCGFPILTGRKILLKNFIYELIWFLNGETNIKYLKQNNVNIWDLWADKNGDLGKVYGYQLRKFNGITDQLNYVINELTINKYSRRAVVNLWNASEINEMALPPCHYSFQFNIYKNKLNITVNMRSCDMMLGFPNDICFYSSLLLVISNELNLKPGNICFFISNAHIYNNQIESLAEYLNKKIYKLPKMTFIGNLKNLNFNNFTLLNYNSEPLIKIKITK
jgi:thymidylate synthase